MFKRSLLGLVAAATTVSLAACGSSDDTSKAADDASSSSSTDAPKLTLISDGTLTVCSDVPYAPFEDFDKSAPSGFTGFDIDIVSQVATDLGLKLTVTDQSFDSLESGLALNAGTCDLVASAMTITDDRAKNLAFTDGYYNSAQSLLVPEGSDIKAIADLDGKKVGVQKGTTGESYTAENAKGATAVSFPSDAEMFTALKAGQVDALLQDLPVNVEHQKAGGYTVVETYKTDENYGFAAKKDNTALVDAIDADLTKLHSNGTYDTIYNKYFATN